MAAGGSRDNLGARATPVKGACRLCTGFFALVIGLGLAGVATAHTRSQSFSSWLIRDGQVRMTFSIRSIEATRLPLIEGDIGNINALLLAHLAPRIAVAVRGEACRSDDGPRALAAQPGYLRVEWHFACPAATSIEITNDAFFVLASSHIHFARVRVGDGPAMEHLFTDAERRHVISVGGGPMAERRGASFGAYVILGAKHILTGFDHIAFLLALLLLCRRVREVVFLVSGFTLGHSITLSIAALGMVHPNVPVIEALIGFTIALVAAENIGVTAHASRVIAVVGGTAFAALALLRVIGEIGPPAVMLFGLALFTVCYLLLSETQEAAARIRPALTILFGLIHGFGFASVLTVIGLPTNRVVPALFGFNLGVEIGQLGIVTALGIVAMMVAQRRPEAAHRIGLDMASAALCGLGLFWFVQRAFVQ